MTFHATAIPAGGTAPCSRRLCSTTVFGQASLSWYPVAITQSGSRADVEAPAHGVERMHAPAKPLPLVRGRACERVPEPDLRCANAGHTEGRRRRADRVGRSAAPGGSARRGAPRTLACACARTCVPGTPAYRHVGARASAIVRAACVGLIPVRALPGLCTPYTRFTSLCDFRIQPPLAGLNARRSFARVRLAWAHHRPAIPMVL